MYNNRYPPTPPPSDRSSKRQLLIVAATLFIIAGLGMTLFWVFFSLPSLAAHSSTASTNKHSVASGTQGITAASTTKPGVTPTAKPTAKPTATPTTKPIATPTAKLTAAPTARPTVAPTATPNPNEDPNPNTPPLSLKQRPEGTAITAVGGKYTLRPPNSGAVGGTWLLFWNGDNVILKGQGYFSVRWEVAYFNKVGSVYRIAQIVMPTWTNQTGTLMHVASGGGYRMDDLRPEATAEKGQTWMGKPSIGFDTLPPGTPMIWEVEYYYLNGTVTLHENEGWADYNLGVAPVTWSEINADINTPPKKYSIWTIRYGIVYDH